MYKRSSKFVNRLWPKPQTLARSAEEANEDLVRRRNARVPAPAPLSDEERDFMRDNLRNILGNLAGDASPADLLATLPGRDIEFLVRMMAQLERVAPPPIDPAKWHLLKASDAQWLAVSNFMLPIIEVLLREFRQNLNSPT